MGHASIAETEGAYGHLVREHHERDVDALDVAFRAAMTPDDDDGGTRGSLDSRRPAASHCVPPAAGQSLSADQSDEESMVEGKGFEPWNSPSALMTLARRSRSASACLAMARCMSWGRSICLTSTVATLMPQGSVCSSMIRWSCWLILSRADRRSSSSTWPSTLRSVVCAICEVA